MQEQKGRHNNNAHKAEALFIICSTLNLTYYTNSMYWDR